VVGNWLGCRACQLSSICWSHVDLPLCSNYMFGPCETQTVHAGLKGWIYLIHLQQAYKCLRTCQQCVQKMVDKYVCHLSKGRCRLLCGSKRSLRPLRTLPADMEVQTAVLCGIGMYKSTHSRRPGPACANRTGSQPRLQQLPEHRCNIYRQLTLRIPESRQVS